MEDLFNREAEQQLLGMMLFDNNIIPDVTTMVPDDAFGVVTHRLIYNSICSVYESNGRCDLIQLSDDLDKKEELNRIGGNIYLYDIQAPIVESESYKFCIGLINDLYKRRRILKTSSLLNELVFNRDLTVEDLVDKSQQEILKLSRFSGDEFTKYTPDILPKVIGNMYSKEPDIGITSGFIELDALIGGFTASDLTLVAGLAGMGKSMFCTCMLQNMAMIHNKPILLFSLEMPKDKVMLRMLAKESGLRYNDVQHGRVSLELLIEPITRLHNSKIIINDESAISLSKIAAISRKMKHKHPDLAIIAIDYLQLINMEKQGTREREVAVASWRLKQLSQEIGVPIILLSQLNRATHNNEGMRPELHNLRESGALEQNASVVMFVHRDDYYDQNSDNAGLMEILVKKNRYGDTGKVVLDMDKDKMAFYNYFHGGLF